MRRFSISFLIIFCLSVKLYPGSKYRVILESDSLFHFRDINDVQALKIQSGNYLYFRSYKGGRSFNFKTNSWKIEVYQKPQKENIYKKSTYNVTIKDSFPNWYEGYGPYNDIVFRKTSRGGDTYILSKHADEGAQYGIEDIIDVKNKKAYRISFQDSRFIEIIEPYIWLGCKSGITRINIETKKAVDFYVLPKYNEISGWVDYKESRFITTEDGFLMKMNIKQGTIDLLSIPKDILKEGGISKDNPTSYPRIANFTNPVIYQDKLYIGFYSTFYNRHAHPQCIIAIYDISKNKWDYIKLSNNIDCIQKLIVYEDLILCIGSLVEGYEGGDFEEFGGVSIVKGGEEIKSFKELTHVPIGLFKINKDTLSILTDKYLFWVPKKDRKNHFYQISLSNFKITDSLEIGEKSILYNRFEEDIFSEKYEEKPILDKWLIKPKLIEVDKAVEIIDFSKKDSLDD